ncbi:MAG: hypothetical protein FJX77_14705 [Armatimonadetes bacterium]|nr:hypothetical protein [Armatimonadota bacterium]
MSELRFLLPFDEGDRDMIPADLRDRNLILFGDPGSNRWLRRALKDLPLRWSRQSLVLAGERYAAADHVPALIHPNPLPGGAGRYLVLNTGHTFGEQELASLNYLLFPRWGDRAVLRVSGDREAVVRAGYFNEAWR